MITSSAMFNIQSTQVSESTLVMLDPRDGGVPSSGDDRIGRT